jgi:hypothetical protein
MTPTILFSIGPKEKEHEAQPFDECFIQKQETSPHEVQGLQRNFHFSSSSKNQPNKLIGA